MNPTVILALVSNLYEQLLAAQQELAALRQQMASGNKDGA